jgi:hypothetical protein
MAMMTRTTGLLVATVLLLLAPIERSLGSPIPVGSSAVSAQGRARPRAAAPEDAPAPQGAGPGVAPAEIQRLFDAYIVMQAQQTLALTDDQFPRFLTRVKVLQEARRRSLAERTRILQRLRQLANGGGPASSQDEAIRTELKALTALDERTAVEVRDAMNGVDEVLDLRQQARFRLFEEQIERRKMELLMRSRQLNRPRNPQPAP